MVRSLIRYALLLLLHVFLVSLWVEFLSGVSVAVELIFFSGATGESLNVALPVTFLLLWWLIPVLLRRADARLAWSSLLLFALGMILCFVFPAARGGAADVESPLTAAPWISGVAWGLVSSAGMLAAIYLRDWLARQRARRAGRAAWWAAVCAFMNGVGMVFSFLLMIAAIRLMYEGAAVGLRSAMWVSFLMFLIFAALYIVLATHRQLRYALYLSLLGAITLGAYALIAGERRELEFRKDGQQWVCYSHPDEGEKEGDLRLLRASLNESGGEGMHDRVSVELAIVEEWYLDTFALKKSESREEKNRCVQLYGWYIQDHELIAIYVLDIHRPGLRLALLLLLSACGMLLLRRAMRAAHGGLPRCR